MRSLRISYIFYMNQQRIILISSSYDSVIAVWDLSEQRVLKSINLPHQQIAYSLALPHHKNQFAAALTSSINVYDLNNSKLPIKNSFKGFRGNVMVASYSNHGKLIYAGSQDGTTRVFDLRADSSAKIYKNSGAVSSVILNPSETQIYTGTQNGKINCFDLVADKLKESISMKKAISGLSMTRDGAIIAAVQAHGDITTIKLKQGSNMMPAKVIRAHNDYVVKAVFSDDNKLATCSGDKTIKIFSLGQENTLVLKKTLFGHTKWVWDAAFNCQSDYLLSCSSDQTIKIWNIQQGQPLKTLKGHRLGVNCIAFNDYVI